VSVAAARRALIDAAAGPYRAAGPFAWHFARGKLRGDPAFTALLANGWIPSHARVLDLGCGQGLLAAWLRAAAQLEADGLWPPQWPAAPRAVQVRGVELMPREVRRARAALGEGVAITCADIRSAEFDSADVVVMLDVLHYLDFDAQDAVLARVHAALQPRGLLLLRVGNASAGLAFRLSTWVDRAAAWTRGYRIGRLYCRSLAEWRAALERLGLSVEAVPMSQGTPFANMLLVARLPG
jgi:SAM-dependent methyltransferase